MLKCLQVKRINNCGISLLNYSELFPANIYLFKVKNRNTEKEGEMYSGDVVLVFLLLTLNIFDNFF